MCVAGLSIYFSQFFKNEYTEDLKVQLTHQARLISESSVSSFSNGQFQELDELAKQAGEQIESRVTIIDVQGVVLGDSEEDPELMEDHADRPEVVDAITQGVGCSTRYSDTLGYDMMYVAVPIAIEEEVAGVSRVSVSLSDIDDSLRRIYQTLALGGIIVVGVALLLAIQISRITVEPIRKLTQSSKRMAEGDLDQQIKTTTDDEVGELGLAFNQMAARIKNMLEEITSERDRMTILLAHIGDALFVAGKNGKVTMTNQAAEDFFGLSREEMVGRTLIEIVRDHEIDVLLQQCLNTREQQYSLVELRSLGKYFAVTVTPLRGKTDCLVVLRDVTEQRRTEIVRRDFISNISHELRTPITSMVALAETLQDGAMEDHSVARSFLEKMVIEMDKLNQMVEELGELSRIESGIAPLRKSSIDITEVIVRVVARLEAQAERAGISLAMDLQKDLPQIVADTDRLEQVMVNLLHNAIKFTSPGGKVTVMAKQRERDLMISVSDTGCGVPATDLSRIFERFYKADKSRSGGGTGLGLAISKHLVQAHGGEIWVESIEGKGSTFSFYLPL
ncbi:MAG: ATP-binding protein [Chloroflexota bacterium]|nr:ATP-binding protein [Chloroflexota bacterium]